MVRGVKPVQAWRVTPPSQGSRIPTSKTETGASYIVIFKI
jgi:hypothetical protein